MTSAVSTKSDAPVVDIDASASPPLAPGRISLRPFSKTTPRILVIGASTGGPQALNALLSGLGDVITRVPVLITQHMPRAFTTILADHLARASRQVARESVDGEPVQPGRIYLAPGGRHMRVKRRDRAVVIALDDGPPVNFCRPAIDPLFESAAEVWGAWVLGVVLTGMGSDGLHGATSIVEAGGNVIAQDEETSVIWGMPGSVAGAGLCARVLPLPEMAPVIARLFVRKTA